MTVIVLLLMVVIVVAATMIVQGPPIPIPPSSAPLHLATCKEFPLCLSSIIIIINHTTAPCQQLSSDQPGEVYIINSIPPGAYRLCANPVDLSMALMIDCC